MEVLIDKLIDILLDSFQDKFNFKKALILVLILIITIGIWQRKYIIQKLRNWIRKINQADKISELDRKVKNLEDVAFRPLKELEQRNQEFQKNIEALIIDNQSLFDENKITEYSRNNTVCKLKSLQAIYSESMQDLILLSEELGNDITASRQLMRDAPRWAQEEGYEAFKEDKRQQKNSNP